MNYTLDWNHYLHIAASAVSEGIVMLRNENNALPLRKDEEIARLKAELRQSQSDYSNLKLAKMIEISDSELKGAKQRISKLVREINKCIGLLSTDLNQG